MYNGIGLTTPRGSGTSGHITRNLSHLRPREEFRAPSDIRDLPVQHRQPDAGILDHERKRKVEVACLELQDELEEKGVPPAEVEEQVDQLRQKLLKSSPSAAGRPAERGSIKEFQRHELLAAKAVDNSRMERALGIRKDYVEGDSINKEKQEQLRIQRQQEREQRQAELAERKRVYEEELAQKKREQEEASSERQRALRAQRGQASKVGSDDRDGRRGTGGARDRLDYDGDERRRELGARDSYRPSGRSHERFRSRSRSPGPSRRRDRSYSPVDKRASRSRSRSRSPPPRRSRRDSTPRRDRYRSQSRSISPPPRSGRTRSDSMASSVSSRSSSRRSRTRSRSASRERRVPRRSSRRKSRTRSLSRSRSRSRSPPRRRNDAGTASSPRASASKGTQPQDRKRSVSPAGSEDMDVESGAGSP